jgi:hypothetical protein
MSHTNKFACIMDACESSVCICAPDDSGDAGEAQDGRA